MRIVHASAGFFLIDAGKLVEHPPFFTQADATTWLAAHRASGAATAHRALAPEGISIVVQAYSISAKPQSYRYTNHRGETAERLIRGLQLWYGFSAFHRADGAQWFVRGVVADRDDVRDFALKDLVPIP